MRGSQTLSAEGDDRERLTVELEAALLRELRASFDELNQSWGLTTDHRIVYSKGVHLVVPRLTTTRHDRVLAFFDDTQRLFYVIKSPAGRKSSLRGSGQERGGLALCFAPNPV